ncbi:MAG: PspC domain-containing protein [Gemmatimonadota bacterium]|nr:MAG: PspC domain-containing protein [Gemmatimonadota bacterium]
MAESSQSEPKRLYRSQKNRRLFGVCGGIGEYFNIDPVIVRLLWILFTLAGGGGIIAYIVACFIVPEQQHHEPSS